MTYFSYTDHTVFTAGRGQERAQHSSLEAAYSKLSNLHQALYNQIRSSYCDLHPHWKKSAVITQSSATTNNAHADVLTLSYFRAESAALMVENLMGIDPTQCDHSGEPYRHPVIELRLAPDYFAIELVLSPFAWWDQQNVIGKLEINEHRQALRRVISRMDGDYRFGFWGGVHFSDMHLTSWELSHTRVFDEWMGTFADGQDWLRFGMWYDPESEALSVDNIVPEAMQRINDLYQLYDFMLWSSNNNFHSFYEKRQKTQRRIYA